MITVGCAGFPVPATRYFKELLFVEIQETHLAMPGTGTIRRWRREAPEGFAFSLLAPREIGQEGFRQGKIVEAAVRALADVAKELGAPMAVFTAPIDLAPTRANRSAVKEFLSTVRGRFEQVAWEAPPGWSADDAAAIAAGADCIAARDPLVHGLVDASVAYYRLPGPAGHKSRYEDGAIERLANLARGAKHDDVTYVFTNVDMFADAKRLKKSLKLA